MFCFISYYFFVILLKYISKYVLSGFYLIKGVELVHLLLL